MQLTYFLTGWLTTHNTARKIASKIPYSNIHPATSCLIAYRDEISSSDSCPLSLNQNGFCKITSCINRQIWHSITGTPQSSDVSHLRHHAVSRRLRPHRNIILAINPCRNTRPPQRIGTSQFIDVALTLRHLAIMPEHYFRNVRFSERSEKLVRAVRHRSYSVQCSISVLK